MIGHHQLTEFYGDWADAEELFATAWTAAGEAWASIRLRPAPGGGLLLDYEEQRDGATMTGHGVAIADQWWWFDSYGFTPAAPGSARWENGELILERSSERGRTTTTLSVAEGGLQQWIDSAVPADAELVPLLRGIYRRATERAS